jgi:hypothetical protein
MKTAKSGYIATMQAGLHDPTTYNPQNTLSILNTTPAS